MSPIRSDFSCRKFRVSLQVSRDIFCASVKSAMQFGTVKYSGRAIIAGFCFAALSTAASAAPMLASSELRTSMWSRLTFNLDPLAACSVVVVMSDSFLTFKCDVS